MSLCRNNRHRLELARKMMGSSNPQNLSLLKSPLFQHSTSSTPVPAASPAALFHSSRHTLKPKKPIPRNKRIPSRQHKKGQPSSTSSSPFTPPPPGETLKVKDIDPQQLAAEFVQFSAARKQGSDSIQELTQTQKLQNYGLAVSLMGFVTWVWYYSMNSVGRAEGGMEQLLSEAEGARSNSKESSVAEREVEELLKAEMSLGSMDSTEEVMGGKGLVVAVAAPEEIARLEEERNLEAAGKDMGGGRPLWKRVVFFWRR